MTLEGTQLVPQYEPEHSQGQCSGCKIAVKAAQLSVLWHRCSFIGTCSASHFPIKGPKPLSPTLNPNVTTTSTSPCSKSDFLHNRSKALGILQAHSGHFLPFSCNKEPFRLGYRTKEGKTRKTRTCCSTAVTTILQKLFSRNAHHICSLTSLFSTTFSRYSLHFSCIQKNLSNRQLDQQLQCSLGKMPPVLLQKGMEKKWHSSSLLSLPPTASFKYEGCCKESCYDGEVISLWGTSPLTTRNNQVQHLKPDSVSALPSMLATSCAQLTTHLFAQPSTMFAACAMLQPHDQLVYPTLLCGAAACPILSHFPLTHLTALIKA